MRRADQQDARDDRRIRKLEADLAQLRYEFASLARHRANLMPPQDIRIGRTVANQDDSPAYPYPEGGTSPTDFSTTAPSLGVNTYRVALSESTFTTTPGIQTPSQITRGKQITAHDLFGGYVPEGNPVIVARITSGPQSGQWYIVAGQITRFIGLTDSAGSVKNTGDRVVVALRFGGVNVTASGDQCYVNAGLWDWGPSANPVVEITPGSRVVVQWFGHHDQTGAYTGDNWQLISPTLAP